MEQENQIQTEIERDNQETSTVDSSTAISPDITNKKINWRRVVLGLVAVLVVIVSLILVAVWRADIQEPILVPPGTVPSSPLPGAGSSTSSLINDELKGTVEFVVRDTQTESGEMEVELVAIGEAGAQIPVYRWEGNTHSLNKPYVVANDKVYIEDHSPGGYNFRECYLGVIDLTAGNGNYELVKLKEFENCLAAEFVIVEDSVYYTDGSGMLETKDIYSFNINTNEEKLLIHADNGLIHTLLASEQEQMIFYRNQVDQETSIFMYDLENDQSRQVCAECIVELVSGDKLVYRPQRNVVSAGSVLLDTYYLYDVNTNTSGEFLTKDGSNSSVYDSYILPFGSEYFYLDSFLDADYSEYTQVYKINASLEKELIYTVQDFRANNILLSGNNQLMISESRDSMTEGTIMKTIKIDFNGNEISSWPDQYYYYPQYVNL